MCGIVGYVGTRNATDVLLSGLANLEYRGYDSAGVTVRSEGAFCTVKTMGRLQHLRDKLNASAPLTGTIGIGHTRWATHGEPSDINSHPHNTGRVTLVHNGIIENYLSLRQLLINEGYQFATRTDTEIAAAYIDYCYEGDAFAAIRKAVGVIEGSYALGILFDDEPDVVYGVRRDSPLIVGLGDGENFIASDVSAILHYTKDYYLLDDDEIVTLRRSGVVIHDQTGHPVEKERQTANWDISQAQMGGYPHFMLKEIYEQPKALSDTLLPRLRSGLPSFVGDSIDEHFFSQYEKIHIVACGTAMHAGLMGKSLIEGIARMPVEVDLASEFRYRDPILSRNTLVIAISQSGETADTLAALRMAKSRRIDTLAVVNVAGSSIEREADYVVQTYAGPEISVASTKAYSVQIGVMYLLAIAFGRACNQIDDEKAAYLCKTLLETAGQTKDILALDNSIQVCAEHLKDAQSLFFLGRGVDHALAMEGSLKLKEISYIHCEAYAAGELKHGTISLITDGIPVVGLVTQSQLLPKIVSNIMETRARGAAVFLITRESFEIEESLYDYIIRLPDADDLFMPLLTVIVLQLFSYHVAVLRMCDVDKPRNLAKSVTVE